MQKYKVAIRFAFPQPLTGPFVNDNNLTIKERNSQDSEANLAILFLGIDRPSGYLRMTTAKVSWIATMGVNSASSEFSSSGVGGCAMVTVFAAPTASALFSSALT